MSTFFTIPGSQRKRKRTAIPSEDTRKRNVAASKRIASKAPRRSERDESISGSESDQDVGVDSFFEEPDSSEVSDDETETAAEKRLRLAERYLENIRNEVEDVNGFDAAEIDRDLIAERLKEDVAETKGKIYRTIADQLDFATSRCAFGKSGLQKAITGCALRLPHVWTISKDIVIEKWEVMEPATSSDTSRNSETRTNRTLRRRPRRILWRRGDRNRKGDREFLGHTGEIISIAVSDSGRFLATGDKHARLIIWDAVTMTQKTLLTRHRDAVTALSFRRGTEQLFSGGADRAILVWSATESAYVETLHGHEDMVIGVAGGLEVSQETCVSVGARDRSARLWKVVEENQLVFRSGGTARHKGMDKLRRDQFGIKSKDKETNEAGMLPNGRHNVDEDQEEEVAYAEGSMDCIALLDAGLFVTGSDNGALSLWSVNRKKPLYTVPLAHGCDPPLNPEEMSANEDAAIAARPGPRLPRYITAIATVPFSDLILTASWDGWVRAWRVGSDKRSIDPVGVVQPGSMSSSINSNHEVNQVTPIRGIVNGLCVQERGDRGKDGLCIVAAVGKEPRLARWTTGKAPNGICVFEVDRLSLVNGNGKVHSLDAVGSNEN